jgi:hypothetical protein
MVKKPLTFITIKEKRLVLSSSIQTNKWKYGIDKINSIPGMCVADFCDNKIGITTSKQVHQALSSCLIESPFLWANDVKCEHQDTGDGNMPVWYFYYNSVSDFFIVRLCKYLQGVIYFCDDAWSNKDIGELNLNTHNRKKHDKK